MTIVFFYLQSENEFLRSKFPKIFDQIYMYFAMLWSPNHVTLNINILQVLLTFIALPIYEKNHCNGLKQKSSIFISMFKVH